MFFSGNYSEDSRQEERRCEALFFLSWKRTVRTNNQILKKSPKGEKSCKSFQIIQNNRLKINLLDLGRFVWFLRDSALRSFGYK